MLKRIGLFFASAFVCFSGLSFAGIEGPLLAQAKPGLLNGKPENKLRVAEWPALHTRILYTYRNSNVLIPNNADTVLVFLTGTGGNPSVKGIQGSVSVPAVTLMQAHHKLAILGVENPIYYEFEKGFPDREQWLNKYSDLDAQLDWFSEVMTYIAELAGKRRIVFLTRSTGTAIVIEAIHRNLPVTQRISEVIATGWVPHSPEGIAKWYAKELPLRETDPTSQDVPVVDLGPKIFSKLTYGYKLDRPVPEGSRTYPKISATVGGNDAFVAWPDQEKLILALAANHPGCAVDIHYTDAGHTLERGFFDPSGKQVPSMDRMKYIVNPILRNPWVPGSGGVNKIESKGWENVPQVPPSDCPASVAQHGMIQDALPESSPLVP